MIALSGDGQDKTEKLNAEGIFVETVQKPVSEKELKRILDEFVLS